MDQVSCSGGESNESPDVKQEGDEGENAEAKARYDFNFMIYDKKLKGSDTKVSALIVDATWVGLAPLNPSLSLCPHVFLRIFGFFACPEQFINEQNVPSVFIWLQVRN